MGTNVDDSNTRTIAMSTSQSELSIMTKPGVKSLVYEYFRLKGGRKAKPTDTNIANCQLHHKWVTVKVVVHPIYLLIFECIIQELNEAMKANNSEEVPSLNMRLFISMSSRIAM